MMKRILVAASTIGLLVTFATGAGAATPTSLSGLTGAQVDALAIAQMRAVGSYTLVVTSTVAGLHATSVTSSTLYSGIRHDDINGQLGEKVFVNGVVYVRFTAPVEKIYFGKVIASLANKWISFTPGQPFYSLFSTTMSESTLAPLLTLRGTLNVSPPLTYDHRHVVAITPAASAATSPSGIAETLYVSNSAPFLPVALVIDSHSSAPSKTLETVTFKNWGVHVTVRAPRHFTASSKFKLP